MIESTRHVQLRVPRPATPGVHSGLWAYYHRIAPRNAFAVDNLWHHLASGWMDSHD